LQAKTKSKEKKKKRSRREQLLERFAAAPKEMYSEYNSPEKQQVSSTNSHIILWGEVMG